MPAPMTCFFDREKDLLKKQVRCSSQQANSVLMDSQALLGYLCEPVAYSRMGFERLQREFNLHAEVSFQEYHTELHTRQAAALVRSGTD